MNWAIFWMILLVLVAGAVGGAANALMTDNGFIFPKTEETASGAQVVRPGFIGNLFTGAIAAVISWGLYGPLSAYLIAGTADALKGNDAPEKIGLSLASLVGALLVGVGGARWLSNEVDKNLLRAAAVDAAGKGASSDESKKIALSTPAQALNIAKTMQ